MRMITFFILVLITVDSVLCDCNCKPDPEPVCSKYDYEEKLLAKTIRLEYRVEEVDKNRNEMETKCVAELEKLAARVATHDTAIEAMEAKFSTDLEALVNKADQLDSQIEEMESRYINISDEKQQSEDSQRKTCRPPYIYDAGTNLCWRLQRDVKLNWFDSVAACYKQGAHLMILNTTAEFVFMQNHLRTVSAGNVFLGASDTAEDGTYKWINGETAHIPWSNNQPNGETRENCLSIWSNTRETKYSIYDRTCSDKYELLCQRTM